jgi:hypothetical protein
MSVTITASQAVSGDVLRDPDGNLWLRQPGSNGQVFELIHVFNRGDILRSMDDTTTHLDIATADLMLAPLTLVMRDGRQVGDSLPEPEPPREVEFTWYLHGGKPFEERERWEHHLGFTVTDELLEKIGQPFYEVALSCRLDTQTGKVEILGAKG